ncbi:hypothetical protein VKT23_012900 [Stygiomarasmius scandens]|uniref:Uncharacterized protein n=1 Tax=Marasmiellus scandens TaxID=2682957 RepID=A0ABR1J4P2_9AGAR
MGSHSNTRRQHTQAQHAFQPFHPVIQDADTDPPSPNPDDSLVSSQEPTKGITLTEPIPDVGASHDTSTVLMDPLTTADLKLGADTTTGVATVTTVVVVSTETVVPVISFTVPAVSTQESSPPFAPNSAASSQPPSTVITSSVNIPTELLSLLSTSQLTSHSSSSIPSPSSTTSLSSYSSNSNSTTSSENTSPAAAHTSSFYIGLVLGIIIFIACITAFISWFMGIRRKHKSLKAVPWTWKPELKGDNSGSGESTAWSDNSERKRWSGDTKADPLPSSADAPFQQEDSEFDVHNLKAVSHWEPRGDRDAGEPKRTRSFIESACSPVKRRPLPILSVPSPPPPTVPSYLPSFHSNPNLYANAHTHMAGITPYHAHPHAHPYSHPPATETDEKGLGDHAYSSVSLQESQAYPLPYTPQSQSRPSLASNSEYSTSTMKSPCSTSSSAHVYGRPLPPIPIPSPASIRTKHGEDGVEVGIGIPTSQTYAGLGSSSFWDGQVDGSSGSRDDQRFGDVDVEKGHPNSNLESSARISSSQSWTLGLFGSRGGVSASKEEEEDNLTRLPRHISRQSRNRNQGRERWRVGSGSGSGMGMHARVNEESFS